MSVKDVAISDLSITAPPSGDQTVAPNVLDRIDVPAVLCDQCHQEKTLFLCARCRNVSYCGKECQKAAWKTHEIFCRNHSLIPKDNEIVCTFKEGNVVRDMTQAEFKQRLGSTFVRASLFSKRALEVANKSFIGLSESPLPVENSAALYHQGSMGYGLVALRDIRRKEKICNFGGIAVPQVDWDKEIHSSRAWLYNAGGSSFYFDPSLFASLGAIVNDGLPNGELAALSFPKVYADKAQVPLDKVVMASRDIKAGEVIRVNYGAQHPMRKGPYVLDEATQKELLEKFSGGLDFSLLNRTGWIQSAVGPDVLDASDLLRATEIEHILITPYELAFLHLRTDLNPHATLEGIRGLPSKIQEQFQAEIEDTSNILKGISRLNEADKPKFLEIASKISQQSLVSLCELLSNLSYEPSMEHCDTLGRALDKLRVKFFGGLIEFYWRTTEREEFENQFFTDEHQRSLHDETDIQNLPEEFKKCYRFCNYTYYKNVRLFLQVK